MRSILVLEKSAKSAKAADDAGVGANGADLLSMLIRGSMFYDIK
jgi:hypothetical protein